LPYFCHIINNLPYTQFQEVSLFKIFFPDCALVMVKFIEKKVSQIIAVSEAGLAATRR
jgi:hypothetical protein